MVPWKPLPLLTAVTCTLSPSENTSTPIVAPTSSPETPRSSLRCLRGGVSCFSNWPACGLFTLRVGTTPKPTCTASYPSVSALFTAVTKFGSTSITVTLTSAPSSWKAWVMCFLRPNTAVAMLGRLYLYVHAGREVEALQGVDRPRRWLLDVDEPLVRMQLEVLAGILVLEGTADHRVHAPLRRQRDGAENKGPGSLRRVHYGLGRLVHDLMVVGLKLYPDLRYSHRLLHDLGHDA